MQWVPKPVAIRSSLTSSIDKTARELAADFGLTNFRTPEAGKPAVSPRAGNGNNVFEPMKGWRVQLPDDALTGQGRAVCAPTGVTAKIKVDPNAGGLKENPGFGLDRMRANTRVEGSTGGSIPK